MKDAVNKILEEVSILIKEIKKGKYFKLDENDVKIFVYGKAAEIYSQYFISESYEELVRTTLSSEDLTSLFKFPTKMLITDFVD